MTTDTTATSAKDNKAQAQSSDDSSKNKGPGFWRVRSSHPLDQKRVHFRSVSETRARTWLMNHAPRGSEMYLETPDGKFEHYEAERQGDYGIDAEPWAEFDPESWRPPSEQEPPGQTQWADTEG